MGVAQGYGKIVTSGLVFAYDAGDYRNSYLGAPGQNYAGGPYKNYSGLNITNFENGKVLRANGYSEQVFIPTLGIRTVESIEFYNEYDGYGTNGNYNCCPNIYSYTTGGWGAFPWLPATTYTYQIIYKSETGYTHPNYMYHYQYRANGSYITEYGLHSDGQRTHLGDGWYHAWNTFTTSAEASYGFCGMWHYEYYGKNKVSVAAVSIVPGTIIRPPLQFIDEDTTRATSQSLLDLTGNASITLTNVSYSTTGELVFDGTDDTISVNSYPAIELADNVSIEYVYMRLSTDPVLDVIANKYHSTGWELFCQTGNTFALAGRNGDGTYYSTSNAAYTIQNNQYYHLVAIKEGTSWRLYVNGELYASLTTGTTGTWSNTGILQIGGEGNGYYPNMKLPVLKIYNKVLTNTEISNNYKHYKTRFNI
jgi:hypothetical protein